MERVLTAVIYFDEDAYEFPQELFKAFAEGGEYRGTTITAMSRED